MRYAAKRDATEAEVIDALRRFGCTVVALSQRGIPDLLVRLPDGHAHLVECKTPTGRPTPAQHQFMTLWGTVPVVRSAEDAVKWLLGACRRSG